MNSTEEFVALLREDLALPVTAADLESGFDELPGWDSVHLLALLTAVERRTGRMISLPDLLAAGSLREVYALVAR